MNAVTNTWHQLVRRRLWPVALLLVAALVAVPVLLASEPDPVVPQNIESGLALGADDEGLAEPVVAKVAAEDRTRRRRVLGARKDPFRPAPVKKKKKAAKTAKVVNEAKAAERKTAEPTGGTGGGSTAPSTPVVTKPKPKAYPAGSLIVRFGDATSDVLAKGLLKKFAPLPDEEAPLLVYMGLTKNGKKAIFLVDATATATGDGTCRPHPSTCETIELSKGETEFFDVLDPDTGVPTAQYQLDIVAIN